MQQVMTYTFVLVAVPPEADPLFRSFIIAQPVTKLTFVCGPHSYHVQDYISCVRLIQSISSHFLSNTHFSNILLSTSISSKLSVPCTVQY
jgi:hypothetical protein